MDDLFEFLNGNPSPTEARGYLPRCLQAKDTYWEERVLDRDKIAETIANARGHRNGAPTIKNVMDILPQKLKDECYEDADAIIKVFTP